MKVRMLVGVSGGRGDGTNWPPVGGELDVAGDEGAQLCAAGLAVPVAEPDGPVEVPEPPAVDVETRATGEASTAGPEMLIPAEEPAPDADEAG